MRDSHDYLVQICDLIACEVEKYAENNFWYTDDDGEERYYFEDNYNVDIIYRMGFGLVGVRIMVACGGPNVWVDTEEKAVCGYWEATLTSLISLSTLAIRSKTSSTNTVQSSRTRGRAWISPLRSSTASSTRCTSFYTTTTTGLPDTARLLKSSMTS